VNKGLVTDNNGDGVIDAGDLLRPWSQGGWDNNGQDTKDGDTAHPDDFFGWNFVDNNNDPLDVAGGTHSGHGTNVAGTIGAMGNNGVGVTGINWQTQLMAVKVFDSDGSGADSNIAQGIDYAALHGARVSNNSYDTPYDDPVLQNAIDYAAAMTYGQGQGTGMVFAVAAGEPNLTGPGVNIDLPGQQVYPASFTESNIISVAATAQESANLASFSNYGSTYVDVAAPGVNILGPDLGTGYDRWYGTSQATPFAAGVAALLLQENPGWSATQIVQQIENTVTPDSALNGKIKYPGIVNAGAALEDLNWTGGGLTGPATVNSGTPFTVTRSYNVVGGPILPNFAISYYVGTSPTFSNSDTLLATETINTGTGLAAGLHTATSPNLQISQTGGFYIFAVLDSGNAVSETNENNNTASTAVTVTSPAGQGTQVDLSGYFARAAIFNDGAKFANNAGFDGSGHALSENLLGSSVTWNNLSFNLGPANTRDAVAPAGQVINLPAGSYSSLNLLASTAWYAATNMTFTVTYADNSTQTFTQSLSTWTTQLPNNAGEAVAATTGYRDNYDGTTTAGSYYVYGYSFALNPRLKVQSITLPSDGRISVLAITLAPPVSQGTQVDLSGYFARGAIFTDGTKFASNAGADGSGHALSANLLGSSVTWNNLSFNLGPANTRDAVVPAGQTINLPNNAYSSLNLLASTVWYAAPNMTFTVTYTDNSTQTYTRSLSTWTTPMGYAGEATALTMAYHDNYDGTTTNGSCYVYGYSFALTPPPGQTVQSITLPNDDHINILAVTLA